MNGSLSSDRAAQLDCIQANLAVLADRWHGSGTCLRLGATLRFRCWPAAGSELPTVEPPLDTQLAQAGPLLGLAVAERRDDVAAEDLLAALGPGTEESPCYVVADAWQLPWTPYYRRRRMRHSFLVSRAPGTRLRITDAYHNDTSWGQARPGQWLLTDAELAAALPDGAITAIWYAPVPLDPVRPMTDVTGFDGYVYEYRQAAGRLAALDQLCLETWLLDRSRQLHAAFLVERAILDEARVEAHLTAWRQLTEQVYLAFRRVERARPEPPGLLDRLADLLRADTQVFGDAAAEPALWPGEQPARKQPASAAGPPAGRVRDPLWPPFTEAIGHILRVSSTAVAEAGSLADLPAWNSLRLVETIEALESRFCVQFGPDDLVPERLSDPAYLFALVRDAGNRTREDLR